MRILVVEDEAKIANAIKKGFEQEGFAVDIASDAGMGLRLCLMGTHDLIILDRLLPGGIDGMTVCRNVRQKGLHTPILLLTAMDQIEDRVTGLDAGADDYLVKPFAFDELVARVRALLRRPRPNIGTTLCMADLSLNTVTSDVMRNGKLITLSRKEHSLLEYLLRHPHQTVSKDDIISHVWNFDADVMPNTVEVYVGYLRNKIDKPYPGRPLLHTVRGFGYRLSDRSVEGS